MADSKITALTAIAGADLKGSDVIPVVDVTAPAATRKVTRTEFFKNIPALAEIAGTSAQLQLTETDGGSGFEQNRVVRNNNTVSFQTASGGSTVATDYMLTTSINGATQHAWYLTGAMALLLNSTGLGVNVTANQAKLHVNGTSFLGGWQFGLQVAPASYSTAATLGIEILDGLVQWTGGSSTLTLPAPATLNAVFPATANASIDFSVINTAAPANIVTLSANGLTTVVGSAAVAGGTSGRFCIRRVSSTVFTVYRIG